MSFLSGNKATLRQHFTSIKLVKFYNKLLNTGILAMKSSMPNGIAICEILSESNRNIFARTLKIFSYPLS